MKRIFRYLKILKNSKIEFRKPTKNNLVIFDENGSTAPYYKSFIDKCEIIYTKGEKINLYIVLSLFLKFKKITISSYLTEYIRLLSPKFIFHNSFDIRFFKIDKKNFNFEFKKIFTQSGLKNHFDFYDFLQDKKELNSDYNFVWSEAMKELMSKHISGTYEVVGSLINNDGPKFHENKAKKELLLVSQFRPLKKSESEDALNYNFHGIKFSWKQFHKANIDLAVLLKKFCKKNNLDFGIVGCRVHDSELEKFFFSNELGERGWKFISNSNSKKGIHLTANSKYIVTVDSTLGYECFSRGQRVCFFTIRSKYIGKKYNIYFGWPKYLDQEGPCWTSNNSPKDFERLMKSLIYESDNFWINLRKNLLKDIISFDEGNKKFKAFLKNNNIV